MKTVCVKKKKERKKERRQKKNKKAKRKAMSQMTESKYSIGPAFSGTEKVLYTSFNQECTRFSVGTTCGFHVYSCDPILKELFSNSKSILFLSHKLTFITHFIIINSF